MTMGTAGGARADWAGRLERLLFEQRDLLRLLDALSERQGERVLDGETEPLLALVGERQSLVDRLTALSAELEPLRGMWERGAAGLGEGARQRVAEAAGEIHELLARIARRDERDRASLTSRREAVARELGGLSRGRGAMEAYAGGDHGAARFQDREG